MKVFHLALVLTCLVSPGLAAQEAVDLDQITSSDTGDPLTGAARTLTLTAYGDLDLTVDLAKPEIDRITTVGFIQNHRSLLVEARYKDEATLMTDALNPGALFTMTVKGPAGALSFGLIPVPFGEFNIHHIYGGFEDERGDFLPKLWSDLGISGQWRPLSGLTVEPFLVSGFSSRSGGLDLNFQSPGADREQWGKAIGVRTQWLVGAGSYLTLSFLDQEFDQRFVRGRNLAMFGLDAAGRWGPVLLKGGAVLGSIHNETANYGRWANYAEAQWAFSPSLALRVRGGQMDPDDRVGSVEDQADINAGLVWKGEVLEIDTIFFHHWSTAVGFEGGKGYNSDSLMVKVLMAL